MRALVCLANALLLAAGNFPYKEALPGSSYQFPRDHFEHSDYRTEWWYYTGNVHDAAGHRFGFELVFFRLGERGSGDNNRSQWRVDDIYLAHSAVTDISTGKFLYSERLNRSGPGIAGASFAQRRVWNGNWKAAWKGDNQQIEAISDDYSFSLALNPAKPYVIHGVNGVSQKAEGAGRASHYVSFTRLQTSGTLRAGSTSYQVEGLTWMDHEWFTEQLDPAQQGWDWFSAQFNDGTELMMFELRRKDGSIDPYSSGTFVDRAGTARHITSNDFSMKPVRNWTSSSTKATYPVEWRINVPALGIDVSCVAAINNQELNTKFGRTSYWEGAATYSGTRTGSGYLEMTGYDKPVSMH